MRLRNILELNNVLVYVTHSYYYMDITMNERIQELIKQATECYSNGQERTFDKEKFAELIIKECYDHCKGQLMDEMIIEAIGLNYNDGVGDCAIGLLQHFGVESNEKDD